MRKYPADKLQLRRESSQNQLLIQVSYAFFRSKLECLPSMGFLLAACATRLVRWGVHLEDRVCLLCPAKGIRQQESGNLLDEREQAG